MAESVTIIMTLLGIGFVSTRLAQVFRLPHSVFLVLLGVVSGLWLRQKLPTEVQMLSGEFPDIILYILLPPLIFESAYNLRFSDLKKDWFPINLMAIFGLIFSTVLVGSGLHFVLHLPFVEALVFGALISATDPVAVVALFKEIGAPRRLNILVEGESLVNDGTAIVLFRVLLAIAAAPVFESSMVLNGIGSFFFVSLGGVFVGLSVAMLTGFFLRLTTSSAASQLGLTVAAAYFSFIVADHFFHVSGVIATMSLGLYLGTLARLKLNKEALHGMHYLWEFLALACNTIVFLAVGATMDISVLQGSLSALPITIAIVYAARILSVIGLVPIGNLLPFGRPISWSYQAVMIWGGLRGGLAVGLALMLPDSFENKQLFIAMAMAVVFSTLFINALTVAPLMRRLGLTKLTSTETKFYERTMTELKEVVFHPVKEATKSGSLSSALVDREEEWLIRDFQAQTEVDLDESIKAEFDLRSFLLREKQYYDEAIENGILSKRSYVQLVDGVTHRLTILSESNVEKALKHELEVQTKSKTFRILETLGLFEKLRVELLTEQLEVLLHRIFALSEALEKTSSNVVAQTGRRWIHETKVTLEEFYQNHPTEGTAVQSFFIHNAVAAHFEQSLKDYLDLELISAGVYAKAKEQVEHAYKQAISRARALMKPKPSVLLRQVPIFSAIPYEAIKQLAQRATRKTFHSLNTVVKEGDPGDSFYLVISGILEVKSAALEKLQNKPKLFSGDFFGELSLLFQKPRSATVTAITSAELLEISKSDFEELIKKHPKLKTEIIQTAEKRIKKNNNLQHDSKVKQENAVIANSQQNIQSQIESSAIIPEEIPLQIAYGKGLRRVRLSFEDGKVRIQVENGTEVSIPLDQGSSLKRVG
ncbi:MAG: cation:proton antiporter [Bacteriovoracia bacterium]